MGRADSGADALLAVAHHNRTGRMPDNPNTETTTYDELVRRITERVRPVCTYMPEDEFRALVEQMARLEHKYIHYPNPVPRELRKSGERAE
jgi:hypothetical protein